MSILQDLSDEKIAWLRLLRTPKIGRVTFFHLLKIFKSAVLAIEGFHDYLAKIGRKTSYNLASKDSVFRFLEACSKDCVKLVFSCDPEYPREFLTAPDFPPLLFCKGNLALLNGDGLAIVGSRAASIQGLSFTKKLVRELRSICVISGFARGIDSAAHEAALVAGTVAVLGCGVNFIYPPENRDLYSKILLNNGLIVSEVGLDDSPRPNFFAFRNRVISGIAKGILVVEAAFDSGSLITAKYAAEQGKNIFAVPGHPYDVRSAGTNFLLKNGAVLVRSSADVLAEFHNYRSVSPQSLFPVFEEEVALDFVKESLLDSLGSAPISISEIIVVSGFSVSLVNAALAELELSGLIFIDCNLIRKAF